MTAQVRPHGRGHLAKLGAARLSDPFRQVLAGDVGGGPGGVMPQGMLS